MTEEAQEDVSEQAISEWIALVPDELPDDAVGLWQILAAGQNRFQLEGADLVKYVRRNILVLLEAGAIPVDGGNGTGYDWVAKYGYGDTRDAIVHGVVAEWLASQNDQMYPWSVWFALPRASPSYIKM
jgi:hypothetical protein